jgi:phage head maturation protease
LLDHHKQDSPLGLFTVSKDSTGLRVRGQLNLDVQRAREVRSLMKQGALTGLARITGVKAAAREATEARETAAALTRLAADIRSYSAELRRRRAA